MKGLGQRVKSNKQRKEETGKRKYTKIPAQQMQVFLNACLFEGKKIKLAAQLSGIKYTSAKTILFRCRQKSWKKNDTRERNEKNYLKLKNSLEKNRLCQYRTIQKHPEHLEESTDITILSRPIPPIEIISTITSVKYIKTSL